jgi:hypothetical protein
VNKEQIYHDAAKFGPLETEDEMTDRRANIGVYGPSKWVVPEGGTREDPQYQDHLRGNQAGWM